MMQRPELAERRAAIRQAFLEFSAAKAAAVFAQRDRRARAAAFSAAAATCHDGAPLRHLRQPRRSRRGHLLDRAEHGPGQRGPDPPGRQPYPQRQARGTGSPQPRSLRSRPGLCSQADLLRQMLLAEKAMPVGVRALQLDFQRVKGGVGLPIELLEAFAWPIRPASIISTPSSATTRPSSISTSPWASRPPIPWPGPFPRLASALPWRKRSDDCTRGGSRRGTTPCAHAPRGHARCTAPRCVCGLYGCDAIHCQLPAEAQRSVGTRGCVAPGNLGLHCFLSRVSSG